MFDFSDLVYAFQVWKVAQRWPFNFSAVIPVLCYKVFYLHQIVQVLPWTWKTEQFFEKITEQRQFTPDSFRATFDCVGPPCCAHPKRNRQVFGEGDRSGKCYSGRLLLNLTINVDINGILNTVNWIPRTRNIRVQQSLCWSRCKS